MSRTDDAKIAKHNQSISAAQEEVESYYYYRGGDLPVVNLTPYPVPAGTSLLAEITKNGEQSDTFYQVDLSKLGKVAGKDGTTGGNDVYIVSSVRHTVYYVKGDAVKGITYHGLITKNNVQLAQIVTPTGSTTATPTPGGGGWDGTVNSPKLSTGLTAVKWNGSAWVAADVTNTGHDWYDYTLGVNKWANAKMNDGSLFV